MHSNDNDGPGGAPDGSPQDRPGWLIVLPWSLRHIGGVNQVVKSLVVEFRDGGVFSPQLLAGSERSISGGNAEQELIRAYCLDMWSPVDHQHPVRALFSFVYRLPYRCWALRRIIVQNKVRIINPHFPDLSSLIFIAMKILHQFDGQVVLSFHGSDVANVLSTTGVERHLWRLLLQHADHIVVVSDSLGSELLTLEARIAPRLKTIYNGVNSAVFGYIKDGTHPRSPALNRERRILSIGSFTMNKGHDVLVRAFGRVLKEVPDARLVLVGGDGPEIEPIRQLINLLSLEEKITIHIDVPHKTIPLFLSQAELFVLASRREGYPLAVVEAGAAGLPVLCTRTTGSLELISDKVTGRLVEVGDDHALADAMVDLLTHPREAQLMAARFHVYVKNNLTWGHTYKKYLQLAGDGVIYDIAMAESAKD